MRTSNHAVNSKLQRTCMRKNNLQNVTEGCKTKIEDTLQLINQLYIFVNKLNSDVTPRRDNLARFSADVTPVPPQQED